MNDPVAVSIEPEFKVKVKKPAPPTVSLPVTTRDMPEFSVRLLPKAAEVLVSDAPGSKVMPAVRSRVPPVQLKSEGTPFTFKLAVLKVPPLKLRVPPAMRTAPSL